MSSAARSDALAPRIKLSLAVSLDGFIADEAGSVDWLEPYPAEDFGLDSLMDAMGVVVMGRTTYDQVVGFGHWPYEGKRAIVLTNRPFKPATPQTELWSGDIAPLAKKLLDAGRGDIWLLGGGATARAFLAAGCIHTLETFVVPVLLGRGVPLFGEGTPAAALRLLRAEALAKGVVRLAYAADRAEAAQG